MASNLKSFLMTGLFVALGAASLHAGEYDAKSYRSVIGSGGMVAQQSSGKGYVVSGVFGQLAIEVKGDNAYKLREGFWVSESSKTDVEEHNVSLDGRITNYPNPFNSTTNVKFELPGSAFVVVKVYDAVGNEVKTLMNSMSDSKEVNLAWDGTDNNGNVLASGTYMCELNVRPTSGDFNPFVSRNVMVVVR